MTSPARLDRWEHRAEWPLAAIALVFLAAYSLEVLAAPSGRTALAIGLVTRVCWAVFVIDYLARIWLADDRWRWFWRHLMDLLIVVLPVLRPLRLVRLVILVTVLQKAVGNAIRGRVVVYAVAGAVLLVYVASLAVLQAERVDPHASITSFGQALWWSITTITTVGYGDEYPVTTTGRVIAGLLMIGGIGLLGTITATIASWIVQRVAEEDTASQAATVAHIAELRDEIRALRAQLQVHDEVRT
ncbi:potassium channel family protein [Mycolicibacterium confluentis]|uniref:Voltage-gated potassium channel n=1 Tax=Mycolicibacterium confluentis TaxID=28047 RepID=A0A7I7XSP8_9MYCO|nr:potassium channel family protein [Mycolicibacterium confluentis]MCV7321423.1 potassium channel family protein [Mycolicibacterium confluentis]ORV33039.1 ion transporter [Mycolicibacterium confluentis]BBZ32093.1 voltage-gated potassium channel [Mycolicibacterium confluentis]